MTFLAPLWWASVAYADCSMRTSAAELAAALDAAEQAYATLDVPAFTRASTEVDFVVPCLEEPVTPPLAAQLHRLRGLGRFADDAPDAALSSLEAARVLAPDYVFPTDILPEGFELREAYEALPTAAGPSTRLPRPRRGELHLDGTVGRLRPTERPVLFQHVTDDGVTTRYLEPGEAPPFYPGVNKRRTAWLVGAGVTALAAGTLYGLSWTSRADLEDVDSSWTNDDLDAVRSRTAGLFWGGVGLGVAAGAQVVVAARVR